ncbi:Choline-sulfatase [Pirellulimonas nuda]|uniref:Choline-sulfatase n=1 Tax=Pirellulimonas nuda TaxID=2528009 RepID=A0A518D695_9BACT|nr:sulfatase [Pirellulimonas nuda]QDU86979.1 Choline-sulfatase [Pirellulimonas nuda]
MKSLACVLALLALAAPSHAAAPNILFIAVDDLNDWIGCLEGHPQARTPNFDRLAASGVLFTNAHCAAPACNPSRTAVMTGVAPNVSGLYENGQPMRHVLPEAVLLPKYFSQHGYWAGGSGKLLHYFIDAASWDDYFPKKESEDPLPQTLYPQERPLSLPRGGPWQYVETDWGPLDATDQQFGGDWLVSRWVAQQLAAQHDRPFFLACGIYRPHEPWFVPKKYFEAFPLEDVQLPPGYLEGDLDDVPPAGQKAARNRYFDHIRKEGQWRQGVQAYLASIAFADAMLGRVLDALEASPHKDNTIVVLWSDHGWQLGEKEHWQKYTAWRAVTRVPLMVRVPQGVSPALPAGTAAGGVCTRPVSTLSLYPTLTELAGLPPKPDNDGPSLVPLLADPDADWDKPAVTFLSQPHSYGLSGERMRYIHYANGDEELYDTAQDRYEWRNLAPLPEFAGELAAFRAAAPQAFAPKPPPPVESLTRLPWNPLAPGEAPPASAPDGNAFEITIENQTERDVVVQRVQSNAGAESQEATTLAPAKRTSQKSRPGVVWLVRSPSGEALGYFRVDDRPAWAVVE